MIKQYDYDDKDTNIYKTDGYGGTDTDVTTIQYTDNIDLTLALGANIDFKFDASGATDDLVLTLYKRRQSETDEAWGAIEEEKWSTTISSSGAEAIYNFTLGETYGPGHYRFGMARSGSTDTFEVDANLRYWKQRA